jgi:Flp pilus assembly pilin Flp
MQDLGGARERERGATAVEYSLIAALIAAVVVVSVTALGTLVLDLFNSVGPF